MAAVIGSDLKNDWLIGTAGNDVIKGYGGNDTLKGGGGADHIDGGAGFDSVMYTDSTAGVSVDLATGYGYGGFAQGDRLFNIEVVYGSMYQDFLYGSHRGDHLNGMDGPDILYGRGGFDLLDGGNGDDWLVGGANADSVDGGYGYDWASYADSPAGVVVSTYGTGMGGDAEGDLVRYVEALQGSAYADELIGDEFVNTLSGGGGDDGLYAGAGDDGLLGGSGNDRLHGGWGGDLMYGEAGQDRLEGGPGSDAMSGGFDADTFVWSSLSDTGTTTTTADMVYDFSLAEGDRLDLSGIDANVYAPGDQAFSFIGTAPFSGTPGEVNYFHWSGDTIIQLQAGTSMPVMICLDGILTPDASWFVL